MQKRALKTKNGILKTAQKLFAKYGYHATTVDMIAEKAKANKQRIYAYYTNKAKLFEEALIAAYKETNVFEDELIEKITKAPENLTQILITHYINIHKNFPNFWRLITWANLEPEPFYKCIHKINNSTLIRLRPFFVTNRKNKKIPEDVSFEVYIFTVFAICYFYHSNKKTLSYTLTPELFSDEGMQKVIRETLLILK